MYIIVRRQVYSFNRENSQKNMKRPARKCRAFLYGNKWGRLIHHLTFIFKWCSIVSDLILHFSPEISHENKEFVPHTHAFHHPHVFGWMFVEASKAWLLLLYHQSPRVEEWWTGLRVVHTEIGRVMGLCMWKGALFWASTTTASEMITGHKARYSLCGLLFFLNVCHLVHVIPVKTGIQTLSV